MFRPRESLNPVNHDPSKCCHPERSCYAVASPADVFRLAILVSVNFCSQIAEFPCTFRYTSSRENNMDWNEISKQAQEAFRTGVNEWVGR